MRCSRDDGLITGTMTRFIMMRIARPVNVPNAIAGAPETSRGVRSANKTPKSIETAT